MKAKVMEVTTTKKEKIKKDGGDELLKETFTYTLKDEHDHELTLKSEEELEMATDDEIEIKVVSKQERLK